MKLQTIKTNDEKYWFLVDTEANVPTGSYYLLGVLSSGEERINRWMGKGERGTSNLSNLIIAHLPIGESPLLGGVARLPELPKQEEDVEEYREFRDAFDDHLSHLIHLKHRGKNKEEWYSIQAKDFYQRNLHTYFKSASKEKKYSKEELIDFVEWLEENFIEQIKGSKGFKEKRWTCSDDGKYSSKDLGREYPFTSDLLAFYESLSPIQDSWEFVPEWEEKWTQGWTGQGDNRNYSPQQVLKITTNSEGREVLIGTWKKAKT